MTDGGMGLLGRVRSRQLFVSVPSRETDFGKTMHKFRSSVGSNEGIRIRCLSSIKMTSKFCIRVKNSVTMSEAVLVHWKMFFSASTTMNPGEGG